MSRLSMRLFIGIVLFAEKPNFYRTAYSIRICSQHSLTLLPMQFGWLHKLEVCVRRKPELIYVILQRA